MNTINMKPLFCKSFLVLFIITSQNFPIMAQQRMGLSKNKQPAEAPFLYATRANARIHKISPGQNEAGKSITDTLNYPLEGTYAIYTLGPGTGYVSGNNIYNDLAKANYFDIEEAHLITGVLIDFGWATGGNPLIEVAVWDDSKSPGNKIGSTTIPLNTIKNDVTNGHTTFIPFDNPVLVTNDFYVGVLLPTAAGDTVVLYTNSDGDTDPSTAWEQWEDNSWYSYDDPNFGWNLKVSHAIFPVVEVGDLFYAHFMADITTLVMGGTVQFTDLSGGEPEMWNWSFEGGSPAVSTLQNPTVTYEQPGTYDVTLTIQKGAETDTKILANYINVTYGITPQLDTLNWPLPGQYVIFVLNNGGGYVCGTNSFGDLAKANYFTYNGQGQVTGILYDFAWATGGNADIELSVWGVNELTGKPGFKLGSQTIPLSTIKSNISNQQLTFVEFDPPVTINQSFFCGFSLPSAAGDTLVVWSNDDGDTNPGTAWELWNDNTWYPFSDPGSWQLNIALGIHPIVEHVSGIEGQQSFLVKSIFPNPVTGIITLRLEDALNQPVLISVISSGGKKLKDFKFYRGEKQVGIDFSGFTPGLYLLRVTGETGTSLHKVIVQ